MMEYVKTKDIIHVKELLGHVNIMNTMKYIHLASTITKLTEDFICKVAHNLEQSCSLVEEGFDYVTDMDSVKNLQKTPVTIQVYS